MEEEGRRAVDASQYFKSLTYAHFPFLNKAITAYRRSAMDPFAMEVSEWDVPVWFLNIGDAVKRISLIPYADNNRFPRMVSKNTVVSEPIRLSTGAEVQSALDLGEMPGDADLLDAWALYYRGRFGDAIRSLVTAIEVVLEDSLRKALVAKGLGEQEVESRLERTFNNFEERLSDYTEATGRRMPRPMVSYIPYLNGVRLRQELEATRKLRHKIVHEGHRLERSLKGGLQRPMETMSWLFNWFRLGSPIPITAINKKYTLRRAMVESPDFFPSVYTAEGILIKPFSHDKVVDARDALSAQFLEAIDKDTSDLEKFALMCFESLGVQVADARAPERNSAFTHERFFIRVGRKVIVVFLIDSPGLMNRECLERVATRSLALKKRRGSFSSVLCIVNLQNGLAWQLREVDKAIPEKVSQTAASCGITVMTAVDLLLLIRACSADSWDPKAIRDSLTQLGRQGLLPPRCLRVGSVKYFYEQPQVVSVEIDALATVQVGDSMVIRLQDRYHVQTIDSMQKNKASIREAHGGERIGIKTSLHRQDVPLEAPVFIFKRRGSR